LLAAIPHEIHTVLPDNGIQLAELPRTSRDQVGGPSITPAGAIASSYPTKSNSPWTNGQVERMNRTFSEATVRRYPARITNSGAITSPRSSMLTSSASD
jgi:hypothetical protein